MIRRHLLSVFPGIDLLGRAFEEQGYCVVRGPDVLWGGDIERFFPPAGAYEGVIGGSPCQDFSRARRDPTSGHGPRMLTEFVRVVEAAAPAWWLLENVESVPDIAPWGYQVQRFFLNARDCGSDQNRNRRFQFGCRDGNFLVFENLKRSVRPMQLCAMASEGSKSCRRSWADFVTAQGLPADFALPGLTKELRYRVVGNGVPLPMGRALAIAVTRRCVTADVRTCVCQCGRPVEGLARHATAACRKRMERRRRDSAGVSEPGPVTPGRSQPVLSRA